MVNEIEKEYEKLSKKYKLPKFKDIDSEFEISTLENSNFLMRNILRKIEEKLEYYAEVIGNLVHPDASNMSTMYEIRFFSDDEKNDMYMLFKKLMKANRSILELIVINDEKKQAEFIKIFFIEWLVLKKELIVYLNKMKECWEKSSTIEEDLGYFG